MDFQEYQNIKNRMTRINKKGGCTIDCDNCPFSTKNNGTHLFCNYFEKLYPEEAIKFVKTWAEEHLEEIKEEERK